MISCPDLRVGAAAGRADAAGTATTAATARSGIKRFTESPPVGLDLGGKSVPRSGSGFQRRTGQAVEVPDQLLASAHQVAVLDPAAGHPAVNALHEGAVLAAHLVVEGHQVVD